MIVFLSIGSNIEPERHIPACLQLLKKNFEVLKISPIYETDPVGPAGEHPFWHLAVEFETALTKKELSEKLREIERALGRTRDPLNKFAPRTIDLDILPQPDYQNQAFIMIPLAHLAPEALDPETGETFKSLAEKLQRTAKESLRKIKRNLEF